MREVLPIIICPLEIERSTLARHGVDRVSQLVCTGPGQAAVGAWCATTEPGDRPVILAGLAGSLVSALTPGRAGLVSAVIDTDGTRYEPSIPPRGSPDLGTVAAADTIIGSDEERAALAARTGAALVDLESGAFARWAATHGTTWGIVRGISDGPGAPLPPAVGTWTDARGRTRTARVLRDLALSPRLIGDVIRIRRATGAGLAAVAKVLHSMLRAPASSAEPGAPR